MLAGMKSTDAGKTEEVFIQSVKIQKQKKTEARRGSGSDT